MSEVTVKKIAMKIFEVPLSGDEVIDYAAKKGIKLAKVPKNTFLLGEVSVDNEIYGLLGLEKEYWADDKSVANADLIDQIAVKLYDKTGKNTGVIEERILKELSQSVSGAKLPVFTITLRASPYLIDIEKEANKFIFPLLTNKANGAFDIFEIIKKAVAIGADFDVHRKLGNNKIAFIDSKHGGKIEIHIYDIELAKNPLLVDTLALFAGTIKFQDAMITKIDKVMKEVVAGTLVLHPSKKTLELMLNPRQAAQAEKPEKPAGKAGAGKESAEESRTKRMTRKLRGIDEQETTGAKPAKKRGRKALSKDEEEGVVKPSKGARPAKKRGRKKILADEEEEGLVPKKGKGKISAKEEEEVASLKKPQKMRPLYPEDPVREATGITEAISELFEDVGVQTIDDLISANPEELADEIGVDAITSQKIKQWQKASLLRVKAALKDEEDIEPDREEEPDEESEKLDMLDMDL